MSESLQAKLKTLPRQSGCYIFKDAQGAVLYVGKAVNLRQRVRSYFQKSAQHTPKTARMVRKIADLEWIVTDSELEALILECNLIKKHRPPYNVLMRDDKSYPYLCLTVRERFPRLLVTRRVRQDGNRYFGPFANSGAVWETHRLLHRTFPLIPCGKVWDGTPKQRPCLYYHMGRCLAPCAGLADAEQYRQIVQQVALFLEGKGDDLLRQTHGADGAGSGEPRVRARRRPARPNPRPAGGAATPKSRAARRHQRRCYRPRQGRARRVRADVLHPQRQTAGATRLLPL
jgi:excinuclease ABC subunit C